jgi:NAD(P)-dependent dehydrogenase (short-subunit alcohol dehydrogenase family)
MEYGMQGQVALVTGAARDVGRQIALGLAAEGATVAVNYNSSPKEAEAVVAEIVARGGKARAYGANVVDRAAVKAMVDQVAQDFGRLDILVNNAGLVLRQRFTDTTQQDWDSQIGVGLFGVLNTCHAALPYMEKNKFGRIISLAGDSARVGESGLAVTAAARGGVLAFTKSIAKEFGRFNVTANAVTLGLIATAHTDPVWLETNREKIVRQYPLRRIGESEDVAPMVLFLASKQAAWITGQVVSVNGGFAMV